VGTRFRDYLYIPLGGSRKGKFRTYLNTFIVFAVSGLWHGPSLHFILWGIYHAALMIGHTLLEPQLKTLRTRIPEKLYTAISIFIA